MSFHVSAVETMKTLVIGRFHLCLLGRISKAEKQSFVYKTKPFPFHQILGQFPVG